MSADASSIKSVLYALSANLAIAIAKLVAALITGATSMMAEAVHSFADSGNQVLLLWGMRQAKRPPSPEHPLGHGKAVYFWSFIVAIMLFSMGGLYSVYEGWHKLSAPEPITSPWLAIGVLIFAIVAEGLSLAGCIREVNKERGDRPFSQWFRETRTSELLVVFGEDLAALLGLSFALCAMAVAMVTGNPMYDALGSIAIGILLLVIAVMVGAEVKALLIGQGVEPARRQAMLTWLEAQPEVAGVFNMVTLQLGNDVMVAVKARMAAQPSDTALVEAINAVEDRMQAAFPDIMWLFFEPDLRD
ncbi:cation diffusion facilitator family transporter [Hahella sp. SMD15-11]|uniref:Cation diffusion facilitator family transporter n=1 Tax=Thermohahella caldifontis TaxID=3142973 RepID=A0AB39UT27_9GAMM